MQFSGVFIVVGIGVLSNILKDGLFAHRVCKERAGIRLVEGLTGTCDRLCVCLSLGRKLGFPKVMKRICLVWAVCPKLRVVV